MSDFAQKVMLFAVMVAIGIGLSFFLSGAWVRSTPCDQYAIGHSRLPYDIRRCGSNLCVEWYIAQDKKLEQDCDNYSRKVKE